MEHIFFRVSERSQTQINWSKSLEIFFFRESDRCQMYKSKQKSRINEMDFSGNPKGGNCNPGKEIKVPQNIIRFDILAQNHFDIFYSLKISGN